MNKKLLSVSVKTLLLGSILVGCGANDEASPENNNDPKRVNFNQYGNLQVTDVNDTATNDNVTTDLDIIPEETVEDQNNGQDIDGMDEAINDTVKENNEDFAEEAKEGTELEEIESGEQEDVNGENIAEDDAINNKNNKEKQNKANNEAKNTAKGKPFTDVEENEWYSNNISWSKETGVLKGFPEGSFQPNKPMTRAQVATMLKNLFDQGYLVVPEGQTDSQLNITYE